MDQYFRYGAVDPRLLECLKAAGQGVLDQCVVDALPGLATDECNHAL